jgi:ferredoxin
MEKVKVDSDRCLRCGACVACAPNNFDYGEDGESVVINEEVTDETRQAVDMCPVSAIEIVEEEEEEEIKEAA